MNNNEEECPYCSKIKAANEIPQDAWVDLYDEKDPKLLVVADDPFCGNDVRINYCPFCGRKLREELLEDLETVV